MGGSRTHLFPSWYFRFFLSIMIISACITVLVFLYLLSANIAVFQGYVIGLISAMHSLLY
jgi:asparagine N-glycosylation enzyme membrane subunit Stt3